MIKMRLSFILLISQILASQAYSGITENLLKEALEHQTNSSINIIEFEVKNATKKGDNSMSVLHRVNIQYSQNGSTSVSNTSVIVKMQILDNERMKNVTGSVFPTEVSMFSETLKAMNAELPERNRLSPEALYTQTEEPMIIVMEDLGVSGYTMEKLRADLDLEHSFLAMDAIARFHAASVCVYGNKLANQYPTKLSFTKSDPLKAHRIRRFATYMIEWPEVSPEYAEKVLNMSDRFASLFHDAMEYKGHEFNVLNHGDFYSNNVMFKHNSTNHPINAMLIDFQLCKFNSPANDLIIFMSTSISDEVYFNDRDKLIERYYMTLKTTMEGMPCEKEVLSLGELHQKLKDRAIIDMYATITALPVSMVKQKCLQQEQSMNLTIELKCLEDALDEFIDVLIRRLRLYKEMGLFNL